MSFTRDFLLQSHLFSLPDRPDWIPYRTSDYKRSWGFCLSHNQFLNLAEDEYEVLIEASAQGWALNIRRDVSPR